MASACSVHTSTFYVWLNEYPELSEAISIGAEAFDTRVERALAERAIGFSVDVEKWFVVSGELESRIVRKYYPPDVTACIFFLRNRLSDRWRDYKTTITLGSEPLTKGHDGHNPDPKIKMPPPKPDAGLARRRKQLLGGGAS
jgi:hypothetical protein